MAEVSKKLKYYQRCLEREYVSKSIYRDGGLTEEINRINHVKFIIELLCYDPKKLWKENFPYEVEKYERKLLGDKVRARTPHQIRSAVKRMREDPELVKALCDYYKKKKNNNMLIKIKNLLIR